MGTTGRKATPGRQLPSNPRPGLPHRRYSVPETVMRKYTLNKQRELYLESPADTSSATVTAPAAPCQSRSSSEGDNRLSDSGGAKGNEKPSQREEGSGSDHNGGGTGTQSGDVHEVDGLVDQSPPQLFVQAPSGIKRKSSPGRSKPPSRTSTVLDTVSEETGYDLAATSAQEKEEWTTSSATLGVPISTSATTGSSPHEDIAAAVDLPQRNATSCPAAMGLEQSKSSSPNDKEGEASIKEDATLRTSSKETRSSPFDGRGKEEDDTVPNTTPIDDLSSTQTIGTTTSEPSNRPQSYDQQGKVEEARNTSASMFSSQEDTLEPRTSPGDELSSTQTFGATSTEPSSRPQSHDQQGEVEEARNTSASMFSSQEDKLEPRTSQGDELSSTQAFGATSTEPSSRTQSHDQQGEVEEVRTPSANMFSSQEDTLEPRTSQGDELSSTQTFGATSTEPSSRPQSHDQQEEVEEARNTSPSMFSSTGDTLVPHTTQRDELSSSQTFGIISEEAVKSSQDARTSSTLSEESTLGRISGESTSTPEARADSSTSPERLPPSEFEKTTSGYSGEGTSTECCVSTSPSCSLPMSTTSPDQPVTERSTSTQDQTFSLRSESVTFGKPASVIRTPKSTTPTSPPPAPATISDSEQSLGHIDFMNKEEPDFAGLFSETSKAQNDVGEIRSDTVDDTFSSEVKSAEKIINNVRDIACQVEMSESTDTSVSADEGAQSKALNSLPTTEDSGHITEEVSFCGTKKLHNGSSPKTPKDVEVMQKRSWEIVIQPKCYGSLLNSSNSRATFRTLSNKIPVLPSKVQETDFFNGPKTYLVIRPAPAPFTISTDTYPTTASIPAVKEQANKGKSETESVDGGGPYGWSRLTEDERTVRMQHQKHRLWMNRRLASAHALPHSPDSNVTEGALSACVGPGSAYREPPLRDTQLVVPRYSALPRSVSMLVNTSSGECSSNSNSDSECLSLVDSLDESPKSRSKHDIASKLLPEGATITGRNRVLPATPRGKGKAFFVSMAGGLDKVMPVDDAKEPVVAQSMPDKLKRKLSQRQQLMEQRRKKKQGACQSLMGEGANRENSTETLQQLVEMVESTEKSGQYKGTLEQTKEQQPPQVQEVNDRTVESFTKDCANEVQRLGNATLPEANTDVEMKNYIRKRSSKEVDKHAQEVQKSTNSSPKSDHIQDIPSQTFAETHPEIADVNNSLGNRRRRKSRTEKLQTKSPESSESLHERRSKSTDRSAQEVQGLPDSSPKSNDLQHIPSHSAVENKSHASPSEVGDEVCKQSSRTRTDKVQRKSPGLLEGYTQSTHNLVDSSSKSDDFNFCSQTSIENHSQASLSEAGNDMHNVGNRRRRKSTEKVQNKSSELSENLDDNGLIEKSEDQNIVQELSLKHQANVITSGSLTVPIRTVSEKEVNNSSTINSEAVEDISGNANALRVAEETQPSNQEASRNKSKRKCREPMKRAKSEPPPKVNKSSEEDTELGAESTTLVLVEAQKTPPEEPGTYKDSKVLTEQQKPASYQTLNMEKTSPLANKVQNDSKTCKPKNPVVDSALKSITVGKNVPALQTEVQAGIEQSTAVPKRLSSRIPIDHANCQRTDYGAGTVKNRPQHRKHRVRKKSPPAVVSSSNSTPTTSPAGEGTSARISQIPIMKSPVNIRRSLLMNPRSLKSSQLPVLRSRFLQSPPVRRFQQHFEVIPEERSASLESSAEDQASQQKIPPKLVRPASEAPSSTIYSRQQHDSSRIPVRRPICAAVKPQVYTGSKAALAPHVDDIDLVTLSKGWLNFYLLKDGRGTPDSIIDEASSANISDQEERLSAKRARAGQVKRTVTVVGADESRVRQYTLCHQSNEHSSSQQELSSEQAPVDTKSEEQGTVLPALDIGVSRRPSLEKLPLELPDTEDSDHSTTYLCLPSPNRQHRAHSGLLEGSGELACSESSVSSSDEGEKAAFPMRWPSRPMRSRVHRSRSRSNHCRRDLIQSYLQTGNGPGSAGWTVTVAGSNGGIQQLPPDLEMHVTFPANVRRTAASQSDSGLGEENNGVGAGAEDDDSKSRKGEEEHKADANEEDPTQTHRWTVLLKNQGAADRAPELMKSGKRSHHCLPDLSYLQNQSKSLKKPTKKTEGSLPVTSATDEDARKGSMQKSLSQLWPKVQKILESKVIIRKASGHFSQEVKSVSQLLENDIGEMMVRSGLAIKGLAITPEKKPRVPTMSERDLTRVHTAKH